MQIETLHLKQKTQLALDDKDISHRQALAEQQKKAAALIQEKKRTILEQKNNLKDYQDFTFELSAEHEEISKTSSKALKKAAAAEETATKRLLKNKDANATIQSLREQLDDTRDEFSILLDEAFEEIRVLKQELERKAEEAEEFEVLSYLAGRDLDDLTFRKVKKSGNPKTWDPIVTQLVIEMLSHGTPPSCISANILSVVKLLMPGAPIIEELPSLRFIRNCRTVSLHLSKTLAAFEIASQDSITQLFTDGTSRR